MKKYILVIILIFGSISIYAEETELKAQIENKIQLAESYYILMLDEGIGTYAQKKSEKFIRDAREMVRKSSLPESKKEAFTMQIDTVEKELKDSISIKYHTLEGYFPLLKYTASSFFFSPEESEVHTLIKSPDYIAIKNATSSLVSSLKGRGEVVFNSVPINSQLEKLTFSIFKNKSPLIVHTDKNVVAVLNDKPLIKQFRENNVTESISSKLFNAYSGKPLYIITITKKPSDKQEYFYSLNVNYYDKNGYSEAKSVSSSGYAIDERSNWFRLILIHIVLLVLAMIFTYWNQRKKDIKLYSMTFLFFLFGRVLPIIMVPSIMAFKPDADTHLMYSFWWVMVMGVVIFVLPVIAIKMFYERLKEHLPLPDIAGKGAVVGVSIASGVLGFLSIPYIFSFGNTLDLNKIIAFLLFSATILVSGYVMGKVLDDNDKMDEKNLILLALTSGLIMMAFLHGISIYLIGVSLLSLVMVMVLLYMHRRKIKRELKEKTKLESDNIVFEVECNDLNEDNLPEIVKNPPYQKYDYYQKVIASIQPILEGKTTYCVLKGDGGAGKTVTAKILIDSIGQSLQDLGRPVLFLSSNCEYKEGDGIAYAMFYDLLDSTLSMDLFGQREKDEKFNNVVNMASKFLMGPVASFLAAGNSGEQQSFSKNDIYIFVKKKLQELSRQSTLILFVDDLQWIDTASRELLRYIMNELDEDGNILFVFTARDTKEGNRQIKELGLESKTHTIGYIDKKEQRQLLEKSFCISPESSQWIIEWASEQNSDSIYPYILVDAVGNLARTNVFEVKANRFEIREDFDFENPPIPEGPRSEVHQFFDVNPQYVEMLSLAALLGKEFQVSHLSNALDLSYLECVKALDDIEKRSGFVFDLKDKDDVYQFRSQIILDAVRETIDYSMEGMLSPHVTQAMRHFHALVANALEESNKKMPSTKLTMEIANHYYAAGKLYADKAIIALLDAANASRELFEYDDALYYLDKADEVLDITKKINVESKELRILVECDRANVQNTGASVAAEKALAYIGKNSVSNEMLKFVAVRACYDAALQNNYDQEWFRKTREMAKKYLLSSQETLMKAEGYHFYAVSMKPQTDDEREMQRDYFNKAIELTKGDYPQTYAKIANSFAENLSLGDEEDKVRAKELFMESQQIKEHAEIKDLPGMARTYGGLGRLVFFNQPENTEEAKQYFLKDLELSKEIHDQLGISKMNSFLGACEFKLQNYKEALAYFDGSINLMHNAMDVYTSYTSKLEILVIMNDPEALKMAVDQYRVIVEKFGTPHPDTIEKIAKIVESCPVNSECRKTLERLADDHFSS
jgi:hypothetical protein